jgi:hypothetical protein
VFAEVEGLARGVDLPFDGVWLLQHAVGFAQRRDTAPLFDAPLCTMLAVTGDRAGAEDLLVGRNLDWPEPENPVVAEVRPEEGHRFVQVGFTWNVGVFSGMNDAGLVICVERAKPLGDPPMEGPPVEFVARQLLQETGSFTEALDQLRSHTHLRGYSVLLAGYEAGESMAAAVDFGNRVQTRTAENGLLPGVDPTSDAADNAAAARYARAQLLLSTEQIIGVRELQSVLGDGEGASEPLHRILNEETRYSVVFEPGQRRLHVLMRGPAGEGEYTTFTLRGGAVQ